MFNSKRKAARQFNASQLSKWRGSDIYPILRDAQERMEAVDPEYRMAYVTFARVEGQVELTIDYTVSQRATDLDKTMMDAICINAEREAQELYG